MAAQPKGSVTHWLSELKDGDDDAALAAQRLFERYFDRLVRLAHAKLRSARTAPADGEDAALSAFYSFCQGAAAGRYPRLGGREDLWRLLVTITARKVANLIRHETQLQRGGTRRFNEADLRRSGSQPGHGLDRLAGDEPTPEFAALLAEEYQRLLDALNDETLRLIALRKLEGYRNEEIAKELDCGLRSVERKLSLIRQTWERKG